jgi:hypothetical protein
MHLIRFLPSFLLYLILSLIHTHHILSLICIRLVAGGSSGVGAPTDDVRHLLFLSPATPNLQARRQRQQRKSEAVVGSCLLRTFRLSA